MGQLTNNLALATTRTMDVMHAIWHWEGARRLASFERGYRFIADVRQVSDDEAPVTQIPPARTGTSNRYWIPVLVIPALLIAVAAYFVLIRERRVSRTPTITSIVVLPLQNLSGDPGQEYFADGMTDALIGDLAQIGALRVISRTSAMHYKGTNKIPSGDRQGVEC